MSEAPQVKSVGAFLVPNSVRICRYLLLHRSASNIHLQSTYRRRPSSSSTSPFVLLSSLSFLFSFFFLHSTTLRKPASEAPSLHPSRTNVIHVHIRRVYYVIDRNVVATAPALTHSQHSTGYWHGLHYYFVIKEINVYFCYSGAYRCQGLRCSAHKMRRKESNTKKRKKKYKPLFCILLHNDGTVDDGDWDWDDARGTQNRGPDGCRDKTVQPRERLRKI